MASSLAWHLVMRTIPRKGLASYYTNSSKIKLLNFQLEGVSLPISPLFVKYRTKSGSCYLYDMATNEIVRVDEAVYRIADDYHVLDPEEIIEKHDDLSEAEVHGAFAQLDRLQARGILVDHILERLSNRKTSFAKGKRNRWTSS